MCIRDRARDVPPQPLHQRIGMGQLPGTRYDDRHRLSQRRSPAHHMTQHAFMPRFIIGLNALFPGPCHRFPHNCHGVLILDQAIPGSDYPVAPFGVKPGAGALGARSNGKKPFVPVAPGRFHTQDRAYRRLLNARDTLQAAGEHVFFQPELLGILDMLQLAAAADRGQGARRFFPMRPGPVSYTHLDVYKRQEVFELTPESVEGILDLGGTKLGTARCQAMYSEEGRDEAAQAVREWGMEGIIVGGGDGSFMGARCLSERDVYKRQGIGYPGRDCHVVE